MEILVLFGLMIGLFGGIVLTTSYFKNKKLREVKNQSVILLEKINKVCKLITVEGEFSEVFAHRNDKSLFFKLLQSQKKALVIVKAKVMVGFDLSKIKIDMNNQKREVYLSHFPDPEILSMETDLEYYDVQKGMMNKFSETELTDINKQSKAFIRDKVEKSYLFDIARDQVTDTIIIIKQLIDSVGWELVSEDLNSIETGIQTKQSLPE